MLLDRIRDYLVSANNPEAIEASERRNARRKLVLLRATVYPIDVFSDVRIRDVSATGAKGEADVELAIGQTLHITTDEETYHTGTVRWTTGRLFGLELVNAAKVLGAEISEVDHGELEGHHPRSLRTEIDIAARLVGGRPPRPATVRNVSATGMQLDVGPGINPGQHLVVRIGNAAPIYGRTQWSSNGRIGFKAQKPISVIALTCSAD